MAATSRSFNLLTVVFFAPVVFFPIAHAKLRGSMMRVKAVEKAKALAEENLDDFLHADPPDDEAGDVELGQELNRITWAGKVADLNGDAKLSVEEMLKFAAVVRQKERKRRIAQAFQQRDTDKDGFLTFDDIMATPQGERRVDETGYQRRKFEAADQNGNGFLDVSDFEAFMHPETREAVLKVEADHQFGLADKNGDGALTLTEFTEEAQSMDEEVDFSYEDAKADFVAHDFDANDTLNIQEYVELVRGHALTKAHVEKAIHEADDDGDGHIHIHDELPHHMKEVLDNEFIEDYFLFQRHTHDEL